MPSHSVKTSRPATAGDFGEQTGCLKIRAVRARQNISLPAGPGLGGGDDRVGYISHVRNTEIAAGRAKNAAPRDLQHQLPR